MSGSNSSSPSLGDQANECPTGHYCPVGTVTPQGCPPGTYNSATRRQALSDCQNCTAGYYCPEWNQTYIGSQCQQGHCALQHILICVCYTEAKMPTIRKTIFKKINK